jgi:predicted transcriptional regulator
MTRHLSLTTEPINTREATLPTSRHAVGQEVGVLAILRGVAPRRPLTPAEARLVAEMQAERLLRLAKLTGPPTPSAIITELPRVLVRLDANLPASGGSHWANGRWLLLINGSEPAVRQRFSLGHEYKHALDHRFRDLMYEDLPALSAHDQAELAADAFAAALLMPRRWVRRAWRDGHHRIGDLAEMFAVHPRAMARRLDTLKLRRLPVTDPRSREKAA